jgi:alpha-maltose-1-phosphate synthase
VGAWAFQKGCDILAEAVRRTPGVRLVHVGGVGDCRFPTDDARFRHVGHVQQNSLARFYAAADVFVLASRQDGLGMVLSQALASGLPVVCTDRTGGADLAHTPALAARITVVPHSDVAALAAALAAWRDRLRAGKGLPPLAEGDRETLSWNAYARRHSDELLRVS